MPPKFIPNLTPTLSRRDALAWLARASAGAILGCKLGPSEPVPPEVEARLTARPVAARTTASAGASRLFLGEGRDGYYIVPAGFDPDAPLPLVLFFHGANGSAQNLIASLQPLADESGFAMLLPDSRAFSWDIRSGAFGPDIVFIDDALRDVFARVAVDPARIGAAGFSDGASYALAVGRANGDFTRRIAAFSPGWLENVRATGKPPIFLTHGTADLVLDIDQTSRQIVPELRAAGYTVDYREFDGGHVIPADLGREGLRWVAGL